MNRNKIEQDIVTAHLYNNKEAISQIYIDLINLKAKLDRWFNKYLDMFDEKMSSVNNSDPVWKLYHSKSEEYSNITQTIKTAEYFLNKNNV
jgi:hypothetical protein